MQLALVGLSHKTAPVEVREKLALKVDEQRRLLNSFNQADQILESVVVSTCNRTEFYFVMATDADVASIFYQLVCEERFEKEEDIVPYLYFEEGEDVVRHLFRVSASLDSMVVGEAQILGQLKDAYDLAFEEHATARIMNKLFRLSFETGKRVRNETNIGSSAVSISYAAVELAKRVFESLEGKRVMLLGAGEMSELTALHMQTNGASEVVVANRTFANGQKLAEKFQGRAVEYDKRYEALEDIDIVVSATNSETFIITKEDLAPVIHHRRGPLFFIDIAVPRNIDPACSDYRNVYVYDVDALDGVVAENMAERMREAERAGVIIEEEIALFEKWLEVMEVEPTIALMREQAEEIRKAEVARAMKRLNGLSDADLKTIEKLTQSITNRMLHTPTSALRESSDGRRGVATVEVARYLYGIEEKEDAQKGFRLIRSLLKKRPSSVGRS